jgi:hypothetical protein
MERSINVAIAVMNGSKTFIKRIKINITSNCFLKTYKLETSIIINLYSLSIDLFNQEDYFKELYLYS